MPNEHKRPRNSASMVNSPAAEKESAALPRSPGPSNKLMSSEDHSSQNTSNSGHSSSKKSPVVKFFQRFLAPSGSSNNNNSLDSLASGQPSFNITSPDKFIKVTDLSQISYLGKVNIGNVSLVINLQLGSGEIDKAFELINSRDFVLYYGNKVISICLTYEAKATEMRQSPTLADFWQNHFNITEKTSRKDLAIEPSSATKPENGSNSFYPIKEQNHSDNENTKLQQDEASDSPTHASTNCGTPDSRIEYCDNGEVRRCGKRIDSRELATSNALNLQNYLATTIFIREISAHSKKFKSQEKVNKFLESKHITPLYTELGRADAQP